MKIIKGSRRHRKCFLRWKGLTDWSSSRSQCKSVLSLEAEEPCATEFLPFAPSHCSKQAGSLWVARWHQLHRHITSWKRWKDQSSEQKQLRLRCFARCFPMGSCVAQLQGIARTLHCGWIQHPWKHYDYVQYPVYIYIYMYLLYIYTITSICISISIYPYIHIPIYHYIHKISYMHIYILYISLSISIYI